MSNLSTPRLYICSACYRVWRGRWCLPSTFPERERVFSQIDVPHNTWPFNRHEWLRWCDAGGEAMAWEMLQADHKVRAEPKCTGQPVRWLLHAAQSMLRLGVDWMGLQQYAIELYEPWAWARDVAGNRFPTPSPTAVRARSKLVAAAQRRASRRRPDRPDRGSPQT